MPRNRALGVTARDPFIDLVRLAAVLLVVVQHWLMPVLELHDNRLVTGNALDTDGAWFLTWVGQVMPLVFFAAGVANAASHATAARRGSGNCRWLTGRIWRLGIPVLPMVLVWSVLPTTLVGFGLPPQPVRLVASIVPQLLWFLGCYLLVLVCTPLMRLLHDRFGFLVLLVLAGAAVLTDVLRFTGNPTLGFANGVLVWLAVHQLGIVYAEDGFAALRSRATGIALGGWCTTALLVTAGPYPASMIGMPSAPVSNMCPPTACLLALTCGQVGTLLLLRPALVRFAERPPVRGLLAGLGRHSMTIYLWHMSALVVVAAVALFGFGYATPRPGSAAWFAAIPVLLAAATATLMLLCTVFGRFERLRRPAVATPGPAALATGTVLLAAGVLGLSATGFAASPSMLAACLVAIVAGLALATVRWTRRLALSRAITLTSRWLAAWPAAAPATRQRAGLRGEALRLTRGESQ